MAWLGQFGRLLVRHDAGCGGGGGEPGERMASVAASRTAIALEGQALAQGDGVRTTTVSR